MSAQQKIIFVVDKEIDVKNHWVGLRSYKSRKERGFQQSTNDIYERWLKLGSDDLIQQEIAKSMASVYERGDKLQSLADDINAAWAKWENEFIRRIELVHHNPFPYTLIRGVLSCDRRFGYSVEGRWFATSMMQNKYRAMDIAMHELMHFMFHHYFDQRCKDANLSTNAMWDVKESFTVLLNLEFTDLRFEPDAGYAPHTQLRSVIEQSWKEKPDFDLALRRAIDAVQGMQ